CLDGTLVVGRRFDRAALARRKRDEAGVREEGARAFGPLFVLGPHRVGCRRVHPVQALADLGPRAASVYLTGDPVRLVREQVILLATASLKLADAVRKELLLAQECRVELLADGIVPGGARLVRLEKRGKVFERPRCRRARLCNLLPERRILHLLRHELERVAGGGLRLSNRA